MANNYPEELSEIVAAALFLISFKNIVLDDKTSNDLHALKNKFLGEIEANPVAENGQELPQINALGVGEEQHEGAAEIREAIAAGNSPELPQLTLPMPGWNPPDLTKLAWLKDIIDGRRCSEPFEKQLMDSDVRDDQNRLSINKPEVENFIIPLLSSEENLEGGIPVSVYDLKGNEFQMTFKIWGSKMHVLIGGWKIFRHQHELQALKDFITMWAFRHVRTEKLCFAISSRRLPVSMQIKRRKTDEPKKEEKQERKKCQVRREKERRKTGKRRCR